MVDIVAWTFPGQGAQVKGMGSDVLRRYPVDVERCSEAVGWDLQAQCLENAPPGLRDTRHVQPALFLVECLTARAALDDGVQPPSIMAGHSLGEYAALHVAGAFDLFDGIALVAERGACMSDAAGGSMAAIIGLNRDQVSLLLEDSDQKQLDLANVNSFQQVVVSGPKDAIQEFAGIVKEHGARSVPLPVSAPFHSRYMAAAGEKLAAALLRCPMAPLRLPVLSNVTTSTYSNREVHELLNRQLVSPVNWQGCMHHLGRLGVTSFVEMGPGTTLTKLWEQELAHTEEQAAVERQTGLEAGEACGLDPL